MGHGNAHAAEIKNPGPLTVTPAMWGVPALLALLGIAAFCLGLFFKQEKSAWTSLLINHFYFFSLALGGLFFASIQWLTSAMWSAPVRRVAESFVAYLPIAVITFIVLMAGGMHELYPWTHADHVQGDVILEGKVAYLNVSFMFIRNIIGFLIFVGFAWFMVGNSVKQDQTRSQVQTNRNRTFTPIFLMCFAILFTIASFDLLMSLDPHWFSTMFGVYCFAGLFYSTLAITTILAIVLKRKGLLEGILNENHLHDMGKFMFAFTVFWAYIGFSQFMLIWYANLPEETFWYIDRFKGGWMYVSIYLLVVKFIVPFFLLIQRGSKRNENRLILAGVIMLISQWVDMIYLVQPKTFPDGPQIGMIEVAMFAGFWGLFLLPVFFFLSKNSVVAIGDPRLAESVYHHHQ